MVSRNGLIGGHGLGPPSYAKYIYEKSNNIKIILEG